MARAEVYDVGSASVHRRCYGCGSAISLVPVDGKKRRVVVVDTVSGRRHWCPERRVVATDAGAERE